MKNNSNSFVKNFEKTASKMPKWFQDAHKAMGAKPIKGHSKKNLSTLMKRRGL